MTPEVAEKFKALRPTAAAICERMRGEVEKLELTPDNFAPDIELAQYRLHRDPASGTDTLVGEWRNARGDKQGEILMHGDGSFFAEYDVIQVHPKKSHMFIEAVTAWGRDDVIKSELRMIPMA